MFAHNLLIDQFRQIDGGHLAFHARDLDRIFHVRHAERTGGHDDIGPGLGGHLHPHYSHSLIFFGLVEQHQSAAAAAERAVAAAAHLHPLQAGNRIEHIARFVVNLVVPPQIAGVVVGVDIGSVLDRIQLDVAGLSPRRAINWLMCSTGGRSL